jgi:NADPH:quinone reductase-like Zn-dependent oxidoreductase
VTSGVGVDMVFDHVGPALCGRSRCSRSHRADGWSTVATRPATQATIPSLGFMFHMGIQILGSDPYRYDEFAEAWELYTAHDFQAAIDSVFPLAEGAELPRSKMLRSDFFGKILLEP